MSRTRHEGVYGSRDIAPFVAELDSALRSGHFTPGKIPPCLLSRGVRWTAHSIWTLGRRKKNLLLLTGIELKFLGRLARRLTLPRLLEKHGGDVI